MLATVASRRRDENMTNDFGLDDIVGDSNDGAYQKTENRQGPPLEYVSEKMENALGHLHHAVGSIERAVPSSENKNKLLFSARCAFQQELVAFLALHNLLALANEAGLTERLIKLSREDFEEWLRDMRAEGSVTG